MASLKIYKIWYIATAAVLLASPLFVRISWSDFRDFLADAKWFILYWIAVVLSVVFSINPARSQIALMADAIYPCVFLIFYAVGLRSPYDAIERMMRLQVWAAALVLPIIFDVHLQGRSGFRLSFVLPYVAPFVVSAICRGNKLAIAELAILVNLMLFTNARAPIGVTFLLSAVSFIVFSASLRQFLVLSITSALACGGTLAAALSIPALRLILLTTVFRYTQSPWANIGASPDHSTDTLVRDRISELFWSMFGDGGWTGIGYFAFGPIYVARWPATYSPYPRWPNTYSEMSLHSIYEVWWLETGYLGTAAAAFLLIAFFVRMYQSRNDHLVKACTLGAVGALMVGTVYQMHQAPMLYVMLGMGLGAARKLVAAAPGSSPADAVSIS